MKLTTLKLENFKSFRGELTIPFNSGFSAITGPNGSGKSNIGDAIQFVLGVRSSKSLRAENAAGLIYNGGTKGRPADYCRVSLVFTNPESEEGFRRVRLDEEEIRFSRTVKKGKKGKTTSTYHLNDRLSSQAEFRRLLASAGALPEGYNIILQNDVQELANMTPGRRRRILEEVAGVTAYDDEIKRAERQRLRVEDNIERLQLLGEELKVQKNSLAKERREALRYKELKEQLDETRITRFHSLYRSQSEEYSIVEEEMAKHRSDIETIVENRQEGEKEILALDEDVAAVSRQLDEILGEDGRRIMEQVRRLEISIGRRNDRIDDINGAISDSQQELETLQDELEEYISEQNSKNEVLKKAKESADASEAGFKRSELAEKEARDAISKSDLLSADLNRALGQAGKILIARDDKVRESKLEYELGLQNLEIARNRLASAEEEVRNQRLARDDLAIEGEEFGEGGGGESKEALGLELQRLQQEGERHLTDSENLNTRLWETERALGSAREDLERRSGRDGVARAVKAILDLRDSGEISGIHGTVSELASPLDSTHEEALANAAGGALNNIVVDNDEIAQNCIKLLKAQNLGRATFLPINKMVFRRPKGRTLTLINQPGILGFAHDLLEYDSKYGEVMKMVMRDTLIVESMEVSRRHMGGVRFADLEGGLIEPGGAMRGGAKSRQHGGFSGSLPGMSEVERLQSEVGRLQLSLEVSDSARAENRNQQAQLREKISTLNTDDESTRRRTWEVEIAGVQRQLDRAKGEVEEATKHVRQTGADVNRAKTLHDEAIAAKELAVVERDEARERLDKATPDNLRTQLRNAEEMRVEAERGLLRAKQVIENTTASIELVGSHIADLKERTQRIEVAIVEKRKELATQSDGLEEDKVALSIASEAQKQVSDESSELEAERQRLNEERISLRTQMQSYDTRRVGLEQRLNELRGQLSHKEEQMIALKAEMQLASIDIPSPDVSLPPLHEVDTNIRTIERRLEKIGDVNMLSLTKFDEVVERLQRLADDIKVVEQRRKSLLSLAERLDSEREKILMAVFEAVSANFSAIYNKLTNNGEASLRLENEDSPFEGGLEMIARPPGKSSISISSLSGGEKSMAALALVFAIQQYDPSPFYFLDEVDQNLDSDNAQRIAKLCKEVSMSAQFITVTLRKVSLEVSDHHIGVTHAGDGCSRLIADFDRESALALGESAEAEKKTLDNLAKRSKLGLDEVFEPEGVPEELPLPESLLELIPPTSADEVDASISELADRALELSSEEVEFKRWSEEVTEATTKELGVDEKQTESLNSTVTSEDETEE